MDANGTAKVIQLLFIYRFFSFFLFFPHFDTILIKLSIEKWPAEGKKKKREKKGGFFLF